jgi:hypothetical protein
MAEDDQFDIDLNIGEDENDTSVGNNFSSNGKGETADAAQFLQDMQDHANDGATRDGEAKIEGEDHGEKIEVDEAIKVESDTKPTQQITSSAAGSDVKQVQVPKQAPVQQGVKRKNEGGEDDRPVDSVATTALRIAELNWWDTEDDIRGWANQCGCEDEIKEITFNEHKVNGKSKGYVLSHDHSAVMIC